MRNGIKKIKEIWEFLTYRTGEEDSTEEFRRKITWLSLGIFCFFIFMMVFYCLGGRTTEMYGTISMAVAVGIICLTCMYTENETSVRITLGLIVIIEATMLIMRGAGRGFGVYWILAIPVVYILFFGLLDTLLVGGYFWVLFTLTYLIPVRRCIPYYYFWGIRFYFPYLYTLVFFCYHRAWRARKKDDDHHAETENLRVTWHKACGGIHGVDCSGYAGGHCYNTGADAYIQCD